MVLDKYDSCGSLRLESCKSVKMSDWTLNILLCLTVFNSLTAANEENHDPPCFFNPLCLCSKSYPDLGRVTCKDVLLLSIPHQINSSKLYFLHLENNGLKYLESRFFTRTGECFSLSLSLCQRFLKTRRLEKRWCTACENPYRYPLIT